MKSKSDFVPALLSTFREGYRKQHFLKDLLAGIIVGIVSLPLAIAFAIASGVKPEQGLYTAIVAGFLISALGGSRHQIGGPTGAFIVIIYGIVQQHGYDGLATATLMAGGMLVLMGIAKFGGVIKFIPFPVTVGFTSGIAVIIAIGQIPAFLGLQLQKDPAEFLHKIQTYAYNIGQADWRSLVVALLALGIVIYWPRFNRKIPGSLVSIVVTTFAVWLWNIPVDTIGSRFGAVPSHFPMPSIPNVSFELMGALFQPALAIAMLAGIESLLSAVVADGMTGYRHRSNMELVAQGVANLMSPLFGGIPATGAIARTATNIRNGAFSPIAGIIHALVLLLIMLFFAKWAALIPMATLAAILLVVAYNMSEWRLFVKLFGAPRSDILVLLTTFGLTLFADLVVAIEVGVVLAALLFIRRMSEVTQVGFVTDSAGSEAPEGEFDAYSLSQRQVPPQVVVYEINGPFFFGAVEKFKTVLSEMRETPKVLILRMRHVLSIDSTGLHALDDVLGKCRKEGIALLLSGVHTQPVLAMHKSGFMKRLGDEQCFGNIDGALERAREMTTVQPANSPPSLKDSAVH